jgi:predicted outer membrane repeat protein
MVYRTGVGVCSILLLLVAFLSADTIPGGNVSGTWYQANSPYYINGSITIPSSDTLIIEPGVEVNFLGDYMLTANGVFEAIGTEVDSIHFFPEDTVAGWQGIHIENYTSYTYPLSYCSFRFAFLALAGGFMDLDVDLLHCSFRNNNGAVWITPVGFAGLQITDCVFRNNGPATFGAAINLMDAQGSVNITGCLFENDTATQYGGAIRVNTWYDSTITITDCVFRENWADSSGGAIYFSECVDGVVIEHCTFDDNSADGAYQWNGGGAIFAYDVNTLDVSYSCFYDNYLGNLYGGSIRLSGENVVTLDHCSFGYGTSPNEIYAEGSNTTLDVSNCIFTRLNRAIRNQPSITLSVKYSDFYHNTEDIEDPPAGFGVLDRVNYNGDSCDCYYDIFMDPMFADTVNRDFHLTEFSPCIDAGDTAFAYDPDSTVTDMGAYYYDQLAIEEEHPRKPSPVKLTCTPNPFASQVTISLVGQPGNRGTGEPELKIYDITGRLVKTMLLAPCNLSPGAQVTWDAKGLAPGVYFISVNGSIQQKVVKVR